MPINVSASRAEMAELEEVPDVLLPLPEREISRAA